MDKQEQYKRVFADFDSDGDGKISCSELRLCFVRLVEAGDEDDKVQDLREAFKMYAAGDQNGKMITPKSLKKMLSRLGMRRSTAECGVMIAEFDVNGDGFLDFDEFKVMMS
ncbi:Probable calcium-binding protein CML40 [Linum grandiflorum]